jgi:metal-dependent hydrolase (beta-lactamase superfamily II)
MTELRPPNSDQIELILFGPGYGECVAVHLGENRWIVVDSCLDTKTSRPAVIEYFSSIGINPEESVKLIIISHWHDDHIRGLSDIISSCPKASVCCSSVLTQKEFLLYVLNFQNLMTNTNLSGVSEIRCVFRRKPPPDSV